MYPVLPDLEVDNVCMWGGGGEAFFSSMELTVQGWGR